MSAVTSIFLTEPQSNQIAAFVQEHNLFVLSDEIYESLVFNREHVCLATLPAH